MLSQIRRSFFLVIRLPPCLDWRILIELASKICFEERNHEESNNSNYYHHCGSSSMCMPRIGSLLPGYIQPRLAKCWFFHLHLRPDRQFYLGRRLHLFRDNSCPVSRAGRISGSPQEKWNPTSTPAHDSWRTSAPNDLGLLILIQSWQSALDLFKIILCVSELFILWTIS